MAGGKSERSWACTAGSRALIGGPGPAPAAGADRAAGVPDGSAGRSEGAARVVSPDCWEEAGVEGPARGAAVAALAGCLGSSGGTIGRLPVPGTRAHRWWVWRSWWGLQSRSSSSSRGWRGGWGLGAWRVGGVLGGGGGGGWAGGVGGGRCGGAGGGGGGGRVGGGSGVVWGDQRACAGAGDEGPPVVGVEVVVGVAEPVELVESGVAGVLVFGAVAVVVFDDGAGAAFGGAGGSAPQQGVSHGLCGAAGQGGDVGDGVSLGDDQLDDRVAEQGGGGLARGGVEAGDL